MGLGRRWGTRSGPTRPTRPNRIDELLTHHELRLGLCAAAVGGESLSAYDIAGLLPWTRQERALADLDVFNAALATLETRAHAELLVARGALARTEVDGVVLYSA